MKTGRRWSDPLITLWALPNSCGYTRLGLTVGRRHGDAVRRNRLKRILREAFRLVRAELPPGLDLVCAPQPRATLRLETCQDSYRALARRAVRALGQPPPTVAASRGKTPARHAPKAQAEPPADTDDSARNRTGE